MIAEPTLTTRRNRYRFLSLREWDRDLVVGGSMIRGTRCLQTVLSILICCTKDIVDVKIIRMMRANQAAITMVVKASLSLARPTKVLAGWLDKVLGPSYLCVAQATAPKQPVGRFTHSYLSSCEEVAWRGRTRTNGTVGQVKSNDSLKEKCERYSSSKFH